MNKNLQKQADGLTRGINVHLIVHCSVVVSPLHPAKWLLINQPDLLLSYSAWSAARVWEFEGWYWSCTNDHQELLKHNSLSLSASVSLSLSSCRPHSPLLLPVLMNFIEWSSRVQAKSICAPLDCKNPLLFLLMSEFPSTAIFDAAVLCLVLIAVQFIFSVSRWERVWFCKQTWLQSNLF